MKYFFISVLMLFVGFFAGAYSLHRCPALQRCSIFSCHPSRTLTVDLDACFCPNCDCQHGNCSCQGKCDCNGGVSCAGRQAKACANCNK